MHKLRFESLSQYQIFKTELGYKDIEYPTHFPCIMMLNSDLTHNGFIYLQDFFDDKVHAVTIWSSNQSPKTYRRDISNKNHWEFD